MIRLTILVLPDGRALVTTPLVLRADEVAHLQDLLARWKDSDAGIGILDATEVVRVADLEVDLERGTVTPEVKP